MFICGQPVPIGPVVGNLLVAGAGSLITLFCMAAAMRMLLRPGEHAADHPKRRILAPDR